MSIKLQLSTKAKTKKIKPGASSRDVYRGAWGAHGSILGSDLINTNHISNFIIRSSFTLITLINSIASTTAELLHFHLFHCYLDQVGNANNGR